MPIFGKAKNVSALGTWEALGRAQLRSPWEDPALPSASQVPKCLRHLGTYIFGFAKNRHLDMGSAHIEAGGLK